MVTLTLTETFVSQKSISKPNPYPNPIPNPNLILSLTLTMTRKSDHRQSEFNPRIVHIIQSSLLTLTLKSESASSRHTLVYKHGSALSRVNLLVFFSAWAELVWRYRL